MSLLYFPATHDTHEPPLTPEEPVLQIQSVISSLAIADTEFKGQAWHTFEPAPTAIEYIPASQSIHSALPVLFLYFPATQNTHEPPLGPEKPALQIQSVVSSLAIADTVFRGHAWHTSNTAPTAMEYFPNTQFVQSALPALILYFPATHGSHAPPCAPALQIQLALPAGVRKFAVHPWHTLEIAPSAVEY